MQKENVLRSVRQAFLKFIRLSCLSNFVITHMLMTKFLVIGLMKAEKSMAPAILGPVHVFVSQVGPG